MRLLKLIPDNTNLDFMRWRNLALILSILVTVASLGLVAVRELNLGVDFVGGQMIRVVFAEKAPVEEVRETVAGLNMGAASIQESGNDRTLTIRMGLPEGVYPIAHACLYLACCPKSNAVKRAIEGARSVIQQHGALPVPLKLRNAVTPLMRGEGYGKEYQYAHDHADSYVPGETYLPDALVGKRFYEPSAQGLEHAIQERLRRLRQRGAPRSSSNDNDSSDRPDEPPSDDGDGTPER